MWSTAKRRSRKLLGGVVRQTGQHEVDQLAEVRQYRQAWKRAGKLEADEHEEQHNALHEHAALFLQLKGQRSVVDSGLGVAAELGNEKQGQRLRDQQVDEHRME